MEIAAAPLRRADGAVVCQAMGLFQKLFLTVVACVGVALLTLVLVSRYSLDRGLQRLIQYQDQRQAQLLTDRIAQHYAHFGNWEQLQLRPRAWTLLLRGRGPGIMRDVARSRDRSSEWLEERRGIGLYRRAYLLDAGRQYVAGAENNRTPADTLLPVTHDGQTVGWLGYSPATLPARLPEERALANSQQRAIGTTALVTLLLVPSVYRLIASSA